MSELSMFLLYNFCGYEYSGGKKINTEEEYI
jgi:hypothetical protein